MSRFALLAAFALVASVTASPAVTPLAVVQSHQVIHPSFSDTKCLSATNADNAAVTIQDCVPNSEDQLWSITSSGQYVVHGSKCLDNTNGLVVDGNKLQVYTCFAGNTNQEWDRAGLSIQLRDSGKCLDLTDGNQNNGNVEQIWACTGGSHQQWNIVDGSTV